MTERDTGGPAFPDGSTNPWGVPEKSGMTLRDYFAAAMVSSGTVFKNGRPADTPEAVARQAYELADAMLEAREK
jgi:hypothetical protein